MPSKSATPTSAPVRPSVKKKNAAASPSKQRGQTYYKTVDRLLKIILLIQNQHGWTAARLAQELKVVPRTIYRDLKVLQGAGIPYFFDEEARCYQIRRDFYMKPVELAIDEALAIIALGEHVGGTAQIPLTRPAARAVAKIRSQLPASIRRELELHDNHMAIRLAPSTPEDGLSDVYEKFRTAIAAGRVLHCRYEAVTGKRDGEPFDFKPYKLFFSQRAWYAVGYHEKRGELRCLKLGRFAAVDPTQRTFTVPRGFSIDAHLGNAWRMIRGEKSYKVDLRFDADFADTIEDTHWHQTQETEWEPDGSLRFRCTVDGLDEIVWWILSMGPHCRVLAPGELADRVRTLAEGVTKLYR